VHDDYVIGQDHAKKVLSADASIRSRNSCRSTPPTSCSYAAAPSMGLRRSSRRAGGRPRSVLAPRSWRRRTARPAKEVEREDLLKYGLIPEFVGRLPVVATHEDLDEPSLKLILTQPKNALVKQYQRLWSRSISRWRRRRPARHYVRPAEPRRRRGGRDLERGRRGYRAAALHLCRPDRRRERIIGRALRRMRSADPFSNGPHPRLVSRGRAVRHCLPGKLPRTSRHEYVLRQPDDAKGIPIVDQRTEICVISLLAMSEKPK